MSEIAPIARLYPDESRCLRGALGSSVKFVPEIRRKIIRLRPYAAVAEESHQNKSGNSRAHHKVFGTRNGSGQE
jgi:hypothetical protein